MATSPVKYHYFHRFFTYSVRRNACAVRSRAAAVTVFSSQARRVAFRASLPASFRVRTFARAVRSAVRVCARYGRRLTLPRDPIRGHCQAGSLTGAVHLSKNNAGVLRPAQRGQKPRVEQKGKSWLDPDVQYAFLSLRSRIRQASDCSPANRERELGLDRRETG
jgi:hypothetical protein